MRRQIVSPIESISEDGVIRFLKVAGGYRVAASPSDVIVTLRRAFRAGTPVRVVYDDAAALIEDAVLAPLSGVD